MWVNDLCREVGPNGNLLPNPVTLQQAKEGPPKGCPFKRDYSETETAYRKNSSRQETRQETHRICGLGNGSSPFESFNMASESVDRQLKNTAVHGIESLEFSPLREVPVSSRNPNGPKLYQLELCLNYVVSSNQPQSQRAALVCGLSDAGDEQMARLKANNQFSQRLNREKIHGSRTATSFGSVPESSTRPNGFKRYQSISCAAGLLSDN